MHDQLSVDCLKCARLVSAWASESLHAQEVSSTDANRVYQVALAVRSLVYFQGIITLVERKLVEPSGALLRVLIEHSFVLFAVRKSPELMQELATQDLAEKRKALTGLKHLSSESRPAWMTEQAIEELRSSIPDSSGGGFNAHFWAEKGGLLEVYNTLYRRLNTFSHGAIGALTAYVSIDQNGQAIGIRGDAVSEFGPQFLINGASLVLNVVDGLMEESPMSGDFANMLEDLQGRFNELHLPKNFC